MPKPITGIDTPLFNLTVGANECIFQLLDQTVLNQRNEMFSFFTNFLKVRKMIRDLIDKQNINTLKIETDFIILLLYRTLILE